MTNLPDDELLRRFVKGDGDAFAQLQVRYARLVYSSCLRETREATLAEDAAQGVFLLMSEKAKGLVGHRSLAGWLYRAACLVSRNLVRSEERRRRREESYRAPEPDDNAWAAVEPHLHDAIDRLRPDDREAILLRYMREQSLAEVGEALGLSENTARMRVNRALERMRKHLLKAGVALSTTVLATLMEQRAAYAAPDALLKKGVSGTVGAAATVTLFQALLLGLGSWAAPVATTAVVASVGLTGTYVAQTFRTPEGLQLLAPLEGQWRGEIEYADDLSGRQSRFDTTVTVDSSRTAFSWTAQYAGTTSVDRMTIVPEGKDRYRIENGGVQSSHRLDGIYALTREGAGRFVFDGRSPILGAEVRLTFATSTNSIRLREEIRRSESEPYRLRNEFTLSR